MITRRPTNPWGRFWWRFWIWSLPVQAFLITVIIFVPVKFGGTEPGITFRNLFGDILGAYFSLQTPPPENGKNHDEKIDES